LLKHGLNPSDVHKDGFTPLHRACWGAEERHTDFVRVLLDNGVLPDEMASDGSRPCDYTRNTNTAKLIKKTKRGNKVKSSKIKASDTGTSIPKKNTIIPNSDEL
jgi:ankyrin repeat protein